MYTPAAMLYSLVVSRESVRIDFLITDFNNLDLLSANTQNAYLNAPPHGKAWFKGGPEFGQ